MVHAMGILGMFRHDPARTTSDQEEAWLNEIGEAIASARLNFEMVKGVLAKAGVNGFDTDAEGDE